jgi:hypothetical protein
MVSSGPSVVLPGVYRVTQQKNQSRPSTEPQWFITQARLRDWRTVFAFDAHDWRADPTPNKWQQPRNASRALETERLNYFR